MSRIDPMLRHLLKDHVLSDLDFTRHPAARGQHHSEPGGLMKHTDEVYDLCVSIGTTLNADIEVLEVAAVWHDFGKTYEYHQPDIKEWKWEKKPGVDHIKVGASLFVSQCESRGHIDKNFMKDVEHCILSHHGRTEWGAIEEPKTIEAHILHYADMMSMLNYKLQQGK